MPPGETEYSKVPLTSDTHYNDNDNDNDIQIDHEKNIISVPQHDDPSSPTTTTTNNSNNDDDTAPSATILSCVINLSNTVAGAGMLGLPGAYASSGLVTGTVLLFVCAFFSANGLRLLSVCADTVGVSPRKPSSFYAVASAALPEFTIFIDGAVAVKCFGVATGYFVTVGDCMVDVMEFLFGAERHGGSGGLIHDRWVDLLVSRHFWVLVGLISVLPISFFRTLDALRFASTLSLILIYTLAVGVVMYAHGVFDPCEGMMPSGSGGDRGINMSSVTIEESVFDIVTLQSDFNDTTFLINDDFVFGSTEAPTCRGDIELVTSVSSTLKNLSIFVFSFTCQQNIFSVVNEIKDRTQRRVDTVISMAIGSAIVLYLTVAIEGYRTYGSNVSGDILLNYPQTGPVTVMRIFIAIMVMLSYPLQLDPSRRCITSLIKEVNALSERRRFRRAGSSADAGEEELIETRRPPEDEDDPTFTIDDMDLEHELLHEEELLQQTTENFIFYGITCVFLVLSFIIAMVVSDLGLVLSVVGATGSTMVSYILPGAIYIKLHPHFHFLKLLAWLQLILGCLIVPTALYFVIVHGAKA